jgi:hypothetical protein
MRYRFNEMKIIGDSGSDVRKQAQVRPTCRQKINANSAKRMQRKRVSNAENAQKKRRFTGKPLPISEGS